MKAIGKSPGPRYQATMQLLRTSEALWNGSRLFFARWNLSPSQFNILNLLWDQPEGLSQTELSRQLITHRSNVTGLVDRLEARGLVQRRNVPNDRRAYQVILTPAGRELLDELLPHYYEAAEAIWDAMSIGRVQQLIQDLTRLSKNIEQLASTMKNA